MDVRCNPEGRSESGGGGGIVLELEIYLLVSVPPHPCKCASCFCLVGFSLRKDRWRFLRSDQRKIGT